MRYHWYMCRRMRVYVCTSIDHDRLVTPVCSSCEIECHSPPQRKSSYHYNTKKSLVKIVYFFLTATSRTNALSKTSFGKRNKTGTDVSHSMMVLTAWYTACAQPLLLPHAQRRPRLQLLCESAESRPNDSGTDGGDESLWSLTNRDTQMRGSF